MPDPIDKVVALNASIEFYQKKIRAVDKDHDFASDPDFLAFHKKFMLAYEFYRRSDFPHDIALSHLGGIDFKKTVEIVHLKHGQKLTQTQVPWGPKGNYFDTGGQKPDKLGIASRGKMFNPASPGYAPDVQKQVAAAQAKWKKFFLEKDYPQLPQKTANKAKQDTPPIVAKRPVTYQVTISDGGDSIPALKSYAAAITDNWSVPGETIDVPGGGTQLFLANEDRRECLKRMDFGDKTRAPRASGPSK